MTAGASNDQNGGVLCLQTVDDQYGYGYRASFTNRDKLKHLDFNLLCSGGLRYGDEGSFLSYPNTTRSYTFRVGKKYQCLPYLYDFEKKTWYTISHYVT